MTFEELKEKLASRHGVEDDPFKILQEISYFVNNKETEGKGRELVIRALNVRQAFKDVDEILLSLVKSTGLHPYLKDNTNELDFFDQVSVELHRLDDLGDENIILHRLQFAIYQRLISGQNVILSAPTSSGKSLLVDSLIASKKYKNIVIVVPTIALIDETRKRLSRLFKSDCKIITHNSQVKSNEKLIHLYILTQERVIERTDLEDTDLFVMDEFYKINDRNREGLLTERAMILNVALQKLITPTTQFLLIGPNIETIKSIDQKFQFHFENSSFSTVAIDFYEHNFKTIKDK